MRIMLVNWARIEQGASHGGGVNGYCRAIGIELAKRGHQVSSVGSGQAYEDPLRDCTIRDRGPWNDISRFEVVNSPVVAPSMAQFRDPMGEVSSPELERAFGNLLDEVRPEVVHFHTLEGLSAGCVHSALSRGSRVIFSLHNYHTICPQVYLMQGHRRPCFSFDNGHACERCIPTFDPETEKRRLASGETPKSPDRIPAAPPPPWETISMPAWKPLLNVIQPEPASAMPPNKYARRREAMVDALNACHRVLAVSDFVRRKFLSLGVREELLRALHIGTPMSDLVRDRQTASVQTHREVIRIAFTGYNNWFKGLPLLLDSLELLTPEFLSRIDLTVLALNARMSGPHLNRLAPRLAGLQVRDGYQHEDLPAALTGINLGIVPSLWWDNAPQTVMEFHACGIPVLASDLGGIPEFVRDGVNGLLFRGTDRWDLARRLAQVVRNPGVLGSLKQGVFLPKGIQEHVSELEQVYRDRIS